MNGSNIYIPKGVVAIRRYFGNPEESDFKNNLVLIDLPFKMRLSWIPSRVVEHATVHAKMAYPLYMALSKIKEYDGEQYLFDKKYNLMGGTYNHRIKKGDNALSTHAWGIAIDINPQLAPYDSESNQPIFIVRIFKEYGFIWGGDWSIKDGMHFQVCSGY